MSVWGRVKNPVRLRRSQNQPTQEYLGARVDRTRIAGMGSREPAQAAPFDVAHCIETLEEVREKCDAAKQGMAAIHITQAIELLEDLSPRLTKDG